MKAKKRTKQAREIQALRKEVNAIRDHIPTLYQLIRCALQLSRAPHSGPAAPSIGAHGSVEGTVQAPRAG
jgi:hypothetical protein